MTDNLSDSALLERFVTRHEEAAFAALMRRHGPRVLSSCRRVLSSEHDAEDVAQATFLLLALKAPEIPWQDSVAGWLCGVARRLSLHARAGILRQRRRETPVAALAWVGTGQGGAPFPEAFQPFADPSIESARSDLRRLLDEALNHLPEKYRAPVVLCDLEGLTHEEAARRLGWPAGSMSRRLGHARTLLRRRLSGRGLPAAVALLLGLILAVQGGVLGPRERGRPAAVGKAMAPLATFRIDGRRLESFLGGIGRGETPSILPEEMRRVARLAEETAERLDDIDPGRDRPRWRAYALAMRRSALDLDRAAESGDAPALLAAARVLNESCVRCHLAFQEDSATPFTGAAAQVNPRSRVREATIPRGRAGIPSRIERRPPTIFPSPTDLPADPTRSRSAVGEIARRLSPRTYHG